MKGSIDLGTLKAIAMDFFCWMNADNSRHAIHSFSIIYYLLLTNKKPPSQKGEGSSSVTMLGDFLASSPSKGLYAILSQRLTICKIDCLGQDSVREFSYDL